MILSLLLACVAEPTVVDTPDTTCDGYPEGATRPMDEGAVVYPYSWPEAVDMATRATVALDIGQAPCDSDPVIDWSPFDKLLFIGIPAW